MSPIRWSKVLCLCAALFSATGALTARAASEGGEVDRVYKFGTGARDIGMGQAMTVSAQGAGALYWNPALLAEATHPEIGMFHASLFEGFSYSYLGYAYPFKQASGIGVQVLRYGAGGGETRDSENNVIGSFSESQTGIGIGGGMKGVLTPGLSVGMGINVLSRTLGQRSNSLYGLDVGGMYRMLNEKLALGMSLKNGLSWAQGNTEDKMPARMKVGAGYQLMPGFWLAMEGEAGGTFGVGAEYNVGKFLSLEVGKAPNGSLSMGGGLTYKNARLDMAFNQNSGGLGSNVSTSVRLRFGQNREALRAKMSSQMLARGMEMVRRGEWVSGLRYMKRATSLDPTNATAKEMVNRLGGGMKVLKIRRLSEEHKYRAKAVWYLMKKAMASNLESSYREAELYAVYASIKDGETTELKDWVMYMERSSGIQALTAEEKDMTPEGFLATKRRRVEDRFHKKEYGISLLECQEITQLEPSSTEDWEKLGSLYFVIGVKDKAMEAYNKALSLNPKNKDLRDFINKNNLKSKSPVRRVK